MTEICPQCGSETRTGWWLRWCSNHQKMCRWSRLMTKEEREADRAEIQKIEDLTS